MRHLVDDRKLGRTHSHRRALLRNMVTSLILHERMETTLPKAKELRRWADRMISWGKEGTLHARRQAARIVRTDEALRKLFDGLATRFKGRQGGYTRVYTLGFRRGDAAPMAVIEYLGYQLPAKEKKEKKEEKRPKVEKKVVKKAEKKPEKKAEEKKSEEKKGWFSRFGRQKKEDKKG